MTEDEYILVSAQFALRTVLSAMTRTTAPDRFQSRWEEIVANLFSLVNELEAMGPTVEPPS